MVNPLARPSNYDSMRTVVQQQIFQVKLPIIAVCFQFGYIDSTAESDGRLSVVNGILTDNNLASPYLSKQVSLIGMATDKVLMNKSYALQYSNFLTLNNTGTAVQNIVVNNVTQGSQYTLTAGVSQSIIFNQSGENVLKFTVNAGGNSYISYQVVQVESDGIGAAYRPMGTMGVNCTPTNELLESDIPFIGYGETVATNSFADYHIYFHTLTPGGDCEKLLKKPIIILDGFDPGNERQHNDLYNKF